MQGEESDLGVSCLQTPQVAAGSSSAEHVMTVIAGGNRSPLIHLKVILTLAPVNKYSHQMNT